MRCLRALTCRQRGSIAHQTWALVNMKWFEMKRQWS
jgi:hypothetical protein